MYRIMGRRRGEGVDVELFLWRGGVASGIARARSDAALFGVELEDVYAVLVVSHDRRVRARQIGGDDGYQWCVLVDGRVKWSGMTRREAEWRVTREREELRRAEADSPPSKLYG
jgi:hypothetical protein